MSFFIKIVTFLGIVTTTHGLWAQSLSLQDAGAIEEKTQGNRPNTTAIKSGDSKKSGLNAPLILKPSRFLKEKYGGNTETLLPTYTQSDSISGQSEGQTQLDGNVVLRRGDKLFKADHIQFSNVTEKLLAQGAVSINKSGDLFRGTFLDLQVDSFEGFFLATDFRLLKNQAYGRVEKIDFIDDQHATLHHATYSTCQARPGPSWTPAWFLKADTLNLNTQMDEGDAHGAVLVMKDLPNMPLPPVSFPLTHERKSGLLAPNIGFDSISGSQYTQPYYWNIAPNRDATITPTYSSRRGLDVGTEFRYLEGVSGQERGQIYYDFLSNDPLRGQSRWGYSQQHTGSSGFSDPSLGRLNYSLNLSKVSDNLYWQDFPKAPGVLSQQQLPTDVNVAWTAPYVTTFVRALKFQTLQNPLAPIIPPYDRYPELNSKLLLNNLNGFNLSVEGDYTVFKSDRTYACQLASVDCQPNAQRVYGLTQLSYPMINEYGYITPKFMLHARNYEFESPTSKGLSAANITTPTFSLDGVLNFERPTNIFGRAWTQTLEPRAFFVYTPYRDQNNLPVYDSSSYDFNFASIFTENAFSGNDRISNTKMLTLGGTSRFLDADTGYESARVELAQRIQLRNQDIYLPTDPPPPTGRLSDFVIGSTVNISQRWKVDSAYEYNPQTSQSDLSSGNLTYYPSNYRLVTGGFRFDRQLIANMLDMGWQWPVNDLWGDRGQDSGPGRGLGMDRWYTVGRINYNKDTGQIGDAIVGLEYDAGCWIGRVVLQKLQITSALSNQSIMFQVEFDGVSKVGTNPLAALKHNIPRYQNLRDPLADPSRYANY